MGSMPLLTRGPKSFSQRIKTVTSLLDSSQLPDAAKSSGQRLLSWRACEIASPTIPFVSGELQVR